MISFLEALTETKVTEVKQLIDGGIDVNKPCSNGELPLAIIIQQITSCDYSHPFNPDCLVILAYLLAAGADTEIQNEDQQTPLLQFSAIHHHLFRFTQSDDFSRQQAAAIEAVKLFIQHGAQLNVRDSQGNTALFLAVQYGNAAIATCLLDAGASISGPENVSGTLLHQACEQGMSYLIECILHNDSHVDINAKDARNNTPLDCAYPHLDIALMLLQRGAVSARVDAIDFYKQALLKNHRQSQHYLLQQGVATLRRPDGLTALHLVDTPEAIEQLLQHQADVNAVSIPEHLTPLAYHIFRMNFIPSEEKMKQNLQICDQLIKQGADINFRDGEGKTGLHQVVTSANKALFHYLINKGIDINSQDNQGNTVLHAIMTGHICQGSLELIALLLQHGADPCINNQQQQTPLEKVGRHYFNYGDDVAIIKQHAGIILQLLHVYPAEKLPVNSATLWLLAMYGNCMPLAKALLARGLPVNSTVDYEHALFPAIERNSSDMVRWLIQQGADRNYRNSQGVAPLQWAVLKLRDELVALLLALGADRKACDNEGNNSLHLLLTCLDRNLHSRSHGEREARRRRARDRRASTGEAVEASRRKASVVAMH